MKIRTKNFLYTSGIIILIVTIAFSILYLLMPNYYQMKKEKEIKVAVKLVVTKIEDQPTSMNSFKILSQESFYSGLTFILKDSNGEIIYPNTLQLSNAAAIQQSTDVQQVEGAAILFSDLEEIATYSQTAKVNNDLQYLTYNEAFKDNQQRKYVLTVIYPLQPINEAQEVLLDIYPLVLLICFVIGAFGAYLYSYFSTKRITKISETTRQMTFSNEILDNDIKGVDEISELSKDIHYLHASLVTTNEQLNQDLLIISKLENSKAEFMQMASHELKTPLTALSGIVEGMVHKVGPYQDRDKYLEVCQILLKEQADLINDILYISKLDKIEEQKKTTFQLNELIEAELPKFESFVIKQAYNLEIALEPIKVKANPAEVQRVISNLISNAMKYTKAGGKISLTVNKDEFQITNECEPLKKQDLDQIFEAFYRPDFARNRKDGGTGLGLFIVSQLLKKNQLSYEFIPMENGQGMVFKLFF